MGVKHPVPHKAIKHKTNHQTGWHKPLRNPTTNYAKDTHKKFCERCYAFNGTEEHGICPETGDVRKSFACSL